MEPNDKRTIIEEVLNGKLTVEQARQSAYKNQVAIFTIDPDSYQSEPDSNIPDNATGSFITTNNHNPELITYAEAVEKAEPYHAMINIIHPDPDIFQKI